MLNLLVIASILVLFVCYDLSLGISRFLAPRSAFEITERFSRNAVRRIFGLMRGFSRVRLEYENWAGSELPDRFLLLANHQSLMDIPILIALFPTRRLRFVAKRELGEGIPFVSRILRSQGHALIHRRGEASQAMRSIRRFARRCEREGTCPVIFPEGTRSRDGRLGVFHTAGVRKILNETALPIVIAVVEGGWKVAKFTDLVRNLSGARFRVRVLSVSPVVSLKRQALEAISTGHEEIELNLALMRAVGS